MTLNLNGSQTNPPATHYQAQTWIQTPIQPGNSCPPRRAVMLNQGVLVYSWRLVVERNHGFWLLWYLFSQAHMISYDNQLNPYDRHK